MRGKQKIFWFYFLSLVFSFLGAVIVSELICGTALVLYYRVSEKKFPEELAFHPLFHRRQDYIPLAMRGMHIFQYDPILGYRYRPNSRETRMLKVCSQGFIDNYGCTSETPDLYRKKEGVKRVFIFGGSTVAGSGASGNKHTIAAYLERALNSRFKGPRFEVINFGTGGYTSVQEFLLFANDALRYSPDAVIFYDGFNDGGYSSYAGGYVDTYQQKVSAMNFHEYYLYLVREISKQQQAYLIRIDAMPLLMKFYSTYMLLKLRWRLLGGAPESSGVFSMPDKVVNTPEQAAELYLHTIQNAVALAKYRKIKLMYFFQPIIIDKPFRSPAEQKIFLSLLRQPGTARLLKFSDAAENRYTRLATALKSHGDGEIKVKSLRYILKPVKKEIFVDSHHVNDDGNEIIAGAILKEMEPLIF